jgi:hypothetical protein
MAAGLLLLAGLALGAAVGAAGISFDRAEFGRRFDPAEVIQWR